jgi:hypothetical protein
MFRYIKNDTTGALLIDYAIYKRGMGYVLYPIKQGFTVIYKGLPGYNSACVKHKRSMIVQRANEAIYYTTNNTRFE